MNGIFLCLLGGVCAPSQRLDYLITRQSEPTRGLLIASALMFATWLPPALKSLFSISASMRDSGLQRGPRQRCNTGNGPRHGEGWQACRRPLPPSTPFLWSHHLCNIAVLFTRNCYQRRGLKKREKITCPEQLISVSCISMSAK